VTAEKSLLLIAPTCSCASARGTKIDATIATTATSPIILATSFPIHVDATLMLVLALTKYMSVITTLATKVVALL
jgi:hypothetical protein